MDTIPDAEIYPRAGLDPDVLVDLVRNSHPLKAPDLWLTREEAALALDVGIRTIDRYSRADRMTTYVGPLQGGGRGVRLLKTEVDNWAELNIQVVTPDGE